MIDHIHNLLSGHRLARSADQLALDAFLARLPSLRSFDEILPALRLVCPSGQDLLGNHADAPVVASVHAVSSAAHGSAGGPSLLGRSRGGGKDGASGGKASSSGGMPGASGGKVGNSGSKGGPPTFVPPAPPPPVPIPAAALERFKSTGLAVVHALRGSGLVPDDYVRPICIQGVNVHVWLRSSGDPDSPMVKVPPKLFRAFKQDVQDKCRTLMRAGSTQGDGSYFVSSVLGQQVRLPPSQRAARTNAAVSGTRSNGKSGAASNQSASSEQSTSPVDSAFLKKLVTSFASASTPQALSSPQACESGGSGRARPHLVDGLMSASQGQSDVGTFMGTPSFQGQHGLAPLSGMHPGSGSSWPHIQHGPDPRGHWQSPQHGHLPPPPHGPWPSPQHGHLPQNPHGYWPAPPYGHWSQNQHGPGPHGQLGPCLPLHHPLPHSGRQLTPSPSDEGHPEEPRI